MGEKLTNVQDYYVQYYPRERESDFGSNVDRHHHGIRLGSSTLFLDMHVGADSYSRTLPEGIDPWDLPNGKTKGDDLWMTPTPPPLSPG